MLGGNDDQSLTGAPEGVVHLGQDGWASEYQRRVTELLAITEPGDRLVVWLGLPAMRADRLECTRSTMRSAVERVISGTEVVRLDPEPVISPGGYTARLDGVLILVGVGFFVFQNTQHVALRWLFLEFTMPLWGLTLLLFGLGIVMGWALHLRRQRRRTRS